MTWQPNRQKFLNGGYAIPLGNNISLLMGNSHEQGGITGITPKDDIEAEGGEVIQKTKDSKGGNVLRIFSKYPMFGDYSPSELVQAGANPNEVFKQQEQYKDRLGLNDDGTPKQRAKYGDRIEYELGGNKKNQQQEEEQPFVVPGTGLNLETTEDYKKQQLQQFSETTGLPLEYLEELFEDDDFTAESLANFENETNADNSKIPVNNDYEDAGLFDLFPQQKQEIPVQTPIKNNVEDNTENDEENVSENEEQQRKLYQFKPYENEDEDNNFVNPSLQQNEDDYYTPYDDEYLDASDLDKPVYSVNDVNPSVLPTRKEKEYKEHSETDIANVLNNKSTRAVTDEIWNTLNESDLTYAQKIAIMANWYQESTWRPDVKTGDHGHSYGLAQFNDSGELGQLKNYAKENNLDISKASTQTKFAIKRTKDKGGLKRTRGTQGFEDITEKQAFEMWNSEDPEKATIAYMLLYERPSWAASGNRINAAKVLQRVYPDSTAVSKKLGGEFKLGGLSRSKDYGSKKKPYPSVNKKDFAGGNRSYPIPTKADATDALRLAGLHHRSDVKAKVYKKYPSLRKKAELGLKENDESQEQLRNDILNGDIDLNNGISSVNYGFTSPHKFINTADPTAIQLYPTYNNGLTRYVTDEGHPIGFKYDSQKDGYYIYDQVTNQGGEGVLPEVEVNPNKMVYDPLVDASHKVSPTVQREFYKEHPEARQEFLNRLQGPPKEKGLKEVYPEFDLLTFGRGLINGAVQKTLQKATPYVRNGLELLNPSTYVDPIAKGLGAETYNIFGANTLAGATANTLMASSFGSEAVNYLMGDDKSLIGDFNSALAISPFLGKGDKLYQLYNKMMNSQNINKLMHANKLTRALSANYRTNKLIRNIDKTIRQYNDEIQKSLNERSKLNTFIGKINRNFNSKIKYANPIDLSKAKKTDIEKYLKKHNMPEDLFTYNDKGEPIFGNYKVLGLKDGHVEVPILGSDKVKTFNLNLSIKNSIGTNLHTFEKVTFNNKDYNLEELKEYFDLQRQNIQYVEKATGGKIFGSSAMVGNANVPHVTHDYDIIVTEKMANKKMPGWKRFSKNGPAYVYNLDKGKYGDVGNIDVNVIRQDKKGYAVGDLAEELYRQFFPAEYGNQIKSLQLAGNYTSKCKLKINKTPQQLLDAYDPVVKSVIDSLEINYHAPSKIKHAGRIYGFIQTGDTQKISKGIKSYGQMLMGSDYRSAPKIDFSSYNQNIFILDTMGYPRNMHSIADSPERMQLAFDLWYQNNTMYCREFSNISANEIDKMNVIKYWDGRGGNANGDLINAVKGARSNHGSQLVFSQLPVAEANIDQKNVLKYIKNIQRSVGDNSYKFTVKDLERDPRLHSYIGIEVGDTPSEVLRKITNLPRTDWEQLTKTDFVLSKEKMKEVSNRPFFKNVAAERSRIASEILKENGIFALESGAQYGDGKYLSVIEGLDVPRQYHFGDIDWSSLNLNERNKYIANLKEKYTIGRNLRKKSDLSRSKFINFSLTHPDKSIIEHENFPFTRKKIAEKIEKGNAFRLEVSNKANRLRMKEHDLYDVEYKTRKRNKIIKYSLISAVELGSGIGLYNIIKNDGKRRREFDKILSERYYKKYPVPQGLTDDEYKVYFKKDRQRYKLYRKIHRKEIENELSKLKEKSKVAINNNK